MAPKPLKKILLVEDDVDIQEIAKIALCDFGGFNVDICSSGAETIEKVQSSAPQLIILDVMMPIMDGIMTFQKLKEIPAAAFIPVIFMSAKVQPHEIASYINKGAIGVISKPFNPMQLSQLVLGLWNSKP